MTDLTPEKRAELRVRAEAAKPFVGHDFVAPPFTTIDAADLLALLAAADERDWLQTVVGRLGRINGEYAMEIHQCREALGVDEDTDPHHAAQALAAAVKRVRALAEDWRYKGEFGWGAWQEGHGPDEAGQALDDAACKIIRALGGTDGGPTP